MVFLEVVDGSTCNIPTLQELWVSLMKNVVADPWMLLFLLLPIGIG